MARWSESRRSAGLSSGVNRESVTRRASALPPDLLYDSCAGAREACREVVFSGNLASVKAGLKRHSP